MSLSSRLASAAFVLSLLLGAGPLPAQTDFQAELDAQIKRVEVALSRVNLEQQSVYQQFQMIQDLQRNAMLRSYQSTQVYTPPPAPPDYDDEVRKRRAEEARLEGYVGELDRLYARYRELEEQKRPLLDELSELALRRR
jgi:hypothetical protein